MPQLELVPVTRAAGRAFVRENHRHSRPERQAIFRVGLAREGELVAVAIAGLPNGAGLVDGRTIEILRVCTLGDRNACSRLYGACCRAAAALGYKRAFTYTLASESGASPAAAGFVVDAVLEERSWAEQSGRPRYEENLFGERETPAGPKIRWRRDL